MMIGGPVARAPRGRRRGRRSGQGRARHRRWRRSGRCRGQRRRGKGSYSRGDRASARCECHREANDGGRDQEPQPRSRAKEADSDHPAHPTRPLPPQIVPRFHPQIPLATMPPPAAQGVTSLGKRRIVVLANGRSRERPPPSSPQPNWPQASRASAQLQLHGSSLACLRSRRWPSSRKKTRQFSPLTSATYPRPNSG